MKKALLTMLFFAAITMVNAQRGGYHHNYPQQQYYQQPQHCQPRVVFAPQHYGCNNNRGRAFINVVIAPRQRVVSQPQYQEPRIVKEWVEEHWEQTPNGRIWVEGHYIQREE
jgi:hypothetical protein